MIAKLIPALAQHRETRPMIMGSYSHPLSGKGWASEIARNSVKRRTTLTSTLLL